jgi:hypothetical protein
MVLCSGFDGCIQQRDFERFTSAPANLVPPAPSLWCSTDYIVIRSLATVSDSPATRVRMLLASDGFG